MFNCFQSRKIWLLYHAGLWKTLHPNPCSHNQLIYFQLLNINGSPLVDWCQPLIAWGKPVIRGPWRRPATAWWLVLVVVLGYWAKRPPIAECFDVFVRVNMKRTRLSAGQRHFLKNGKFCAIYMVLSTCPKSCGWTSRDVGKSFQDIIYGQCFEIRDMCWILAQKNKSRLTRFSSEVS